MKKKIAKAKQSHKKAVQFLHELRWDLKKNKKQKIHCAPSLPHSPCGAFCRKSEWECVARVTVQVTRSGNFTVARRKESENQRNI